MKQIDNLGRNSKQEEKYENGEGKQRIKLPNAKAAFYISISYGQGHTNIKCSWQKKLPWGLIIRPLPYMSGI